MSPAPINFVVALPAEAHPIVARHGLRRLTPDPGYPVWRGGSMSLIVSGVGKTTAAAAAAFLHTLHEGQENAIWINAGIAGHPWLATGEALLASPITDAASGRQWHPPLLFTPPLRIEPLTTLERPGFDYDWPGAVDMEAAGFFPTASRFTRRGLVHCFKVVSDNGHSPARAINAKRVRQWIGAQQEALALLIRQLAALRDRP